MSSRVLKKLGLQNDSDIPKLDEASDSDDDISNSSFNKEKFNRYNLVGSFIYLLTVFNMSSTRIRCITNCS